MRTWIRSSWGLASAFPLLLCAFVAQAQVAPEPGKPAKQGAEKKAAAPTKEAPKKEARTVPVEKPTAKEGERKSAEGSSGEAPSAAEDSAAPADSGQEVPASDASAAEATATEGVAPEESPRKEIDLAEGEEDASATGAAASGEGSKPGSAEKAPPKKAEPEPEEPRPNYAKLPWTHHMQHLDLMVGLRVNSALDDGLEPFLEDPLYAEAVGRVGGVLFATQPIALAVLGEVGGSSVGAGVRGEDSKLSLFHMGAGIEGRYFLHPRIYGYARLMAGAEVAWMRYGSFESEAKDNNWAFSGDGVLGAALRIAGSPDGRTRAARVWVFGEGGYRYSTAHEVELEYDEDSGPTRPEPLVFDDLATSGFMGSLGLMITY